MPRRGPIHPFTPRQEQIADGIRRGLTYKQIGRERGISPHTVAAHVKMMAVLFDACSELEERPSPKAMILVYAAHRSAVREGTG